MSSLTDVDWSQIPAPVDDGGSDHLVGLEMPVISLLSTNNNMVDLAGMSGLSVIYAYPMTGRPDIPLPNGWDNLPGARGCTPQSCEFRDYAKALAELGIEQIFGLSTQSTEYQQEAALRLHLPFALLSDSALKLTNALNLPTMQVEGNTLLKRCTLIVDQGQIIKVFYPIFPPNENAERVVAWLSER